MAGSNASMPSKRSWDSTSSIRRPPSVVQVPGTKSSEDGHMLTIRPVHGLLMDHFSFDQT